MKTNRLVLASNKTRRWVCCFGGLLFVANMPSYAAQKTKVTVLCMAADDFSEKATAEINVLARKHFGRSGYFSFVDIRDFLEAERVETRNGLLSRAYGLLSEGKRLYNALELDRAIDVLLRALTQFQKAMGREDFGKGYLNTLILLGATYILSGDMERGIMYFKAVSLYDPNKEMDPKKFPPSMVDIFNKIQKEVAGRPTIQTLIRSNPSYAEVYVDGRYRGTTPITLRNVLEGEHFVRLEKEGYFSRDKRVMWKVTREETIDVVLEKVPHYREWKETSGSFMKGFDGVYQEKEIRAFCKRLGVDRLVLVLVRQRSEELQIEAALLKAQPFEQIEKKSSSILRRSTNFTAQVDAFFASLYKKVTIPAAVIEKKSFSSIRLGDVSCNSDSDCSMGEVCDEEGGYCILSIPRKEFYKEWWFWTIIGGGLAIALGSGLLVWYMIQPQEGAVEFTF